MYSLIIILCRFHSPALFLMDIRGRRFCPLRRLLAFTFMIGTVNIIFLYNNMRDPLETSSGQEGNDVIFHRHISSISHGDVENPGSKPKNVLEELNLMLKDTLEKYNNAISGSVLRYRRALVEEDLPGNKGADGTQEIPRCERRIFLLILVHSSPGNLIDRHSIRLSWGKEENQINQGSWTRTEK